MQLEDDHKVGSGRNRVPRASDESSLVADTFEVSVEPQGGCYGIQVLIAGRRKRWRDEVAAQLRRAGYAATAVDCGLDALSVLVLGLPVDVLVTDADLDGELGCSQLALEARALRPNLSIVFAGDALSEDETEGLSDAHVLRVDALRMDAGDDALTLTVREALLAARAA